MVANKFIVMSWSGCMVMTYRRYACAAVLMLPEAHAVVVSRIVGMTCLIRNSL